jgi:hypothetical protein
MPSGQSAHGEPLAVDFESYSPKTPIAPSIFLLGLAHYIPVAMPTSQDKSHWIKAMGLDD